MPPPWCPLVLPRRYRRALLLGLMSVACLFYAAVLEPNWLEIKALEVTLPHLPAAFEGYRLVHLTDIHADAWMTPKRLEKLVQQVNHQNPDLVVLTGDFVTNQAEVYGPTLMQLAALRATDKAIAVLGNHDVWSNRPLVAQTLQAAGVKVLENSLVVIEHQGQSLVVGGIGDVWTGRDRLEDLLQQLPTAGCQILLVHEPDFAHQSAPTEKFDLQLSGHSHGGQVKIPLLGAPKLPPYGQDYPFGRYQVGTMIQYTGRGVGMVRPRVRLNARPELTVLTLHAGASPTEG
ncbi:metallophosphoesterase [Lyngbya confervoides]|uniref:Metallophosphoesterase n=1 Tax=Lyngbya confervoides BDU141951 TaxID=1574623 RepID=A0ABD4T2L5_9CYAN|nr:metallophosphoesterase [Lyngbya confervoides]MCM1982844.1 metallophosphoesterase [Lyngbya confervoides BDU141951]